MRLLGLAIFTLLPLLLMASAQDSAEETAFVKPVKVWEGPFDPDAPARGKYTVDILNDVNAFAVPWKIFRWGQEVPKVNFHDHFAVLLMYPGSQYSLEGLNADDQGNARVVGGGYRKPVGAPRGKWYVLAIFPRGKLKSVDGVKLPSGK